VARVSIRARTWAESYKNKGLHLRPSSVFLPFSPTANSGLAAEKGELVATNREEPEVGPESEVEEGGFRSKPACSHHEARLEEIVVVCRDRQRW